MYKQILTILIGAAALIGISLLIRLFVVGNTEPNEANTSISSIPSASSTSSETPSLPSFESSESDIEPAPESGRYQPLEFLETRAMWIAYLDFQLLTTGSNEADFREACEILIENCKSLAINTLYVQVRPYGDAMYPSKLFPWSAYAAGEQGMDPGYDPFGILLALGHEAGMAVEAWVNPLRISTSPDTKLSEDNIGLQWYREDNGLVREANGGLYYNPGCPEVHELILNGIAEILEQYDVDGIHFDDYFYPTTDPAFDQAQYDAYTAGGGTLALDDWRREQVNTLVRSIHTLCEANGVPFGISPTGNMEYNYHSLYADVATWCASAEYIDYICPQIYWGFTHNTKPYTETLEEWKAICCDDVAIVVGLAAYKIGTVDGNDEWIVDETVLARQAESAFSHNLAGYALFRYSSLFHPAEAVADVMQDAIEALQEAQE